MKIYLIDDFKFSIQGRIEAFFFKEEGKTQLYQVNI